MKRRSFIQLGALSPLFSLPCKSIIGQNLSNANRVWEPERKIPVNGEYDVVVCGAGPAGVCAAIEAGRSGARVLLVEVHGCLGGVWTAGLLTWILDQKNKFGLMREIENRLMQNSGINSQIDTGNTLSFDAEIMKLVLEELCLEAGVDILLHTRVVASIKNDKRTLTHIITESKSGREAWRGNIFIDTTGDGDLAAISGCGYDLGREKDNVMQPFSMLALVTGINYNDVKDYARWAGDSQNGSPSKIKLRDEIINGGFTPSYLKPGLYPIRKDLFMLMANHEYGYSAINAMDVTRATLHARKEVNSIINALKNNEGKWSNIKLIATAEQIGTREGRRIHGIYTVTEEDLIKGSKFSDAICRVTVGVDIHSVSKADEENIDFKTPASYSQGFKSKPYDIPLRSLISKDVGNLMMAGRCISGDFIAHSSYRVTGDAVRMGEAAGRVGAISSNEKKMPQEIPFSKFGLDQ